MKDATSIFRFPLRARANLRRHTMRSVARVAVLVAADLTTFVVLREILPALRDRELLGRGLGLLMQSLTPLGYLGGWQYAFALFLGLLVAGNYGQGDCRRDPARLLAGSALATALVLWARAWEAGLGVTSLQFIVTVAFVWLWLVAERVSVDVMVTRWKRRRPGTLPRGVLVGRPEDGGALGDWAGLAAAGEFEIVGFVAVTCPDTPGSLGEVAELATILEEHQVDTVLLCGRLSDETLRDILTKAIAAGCHVLSVPRSFFVRGVHPNVVWRRGQRFVELTTPALKGAQVMFKRALDFVGAAAGLVFLSPVLLAIAGAIALDSPGPVLFAQERVGRTGKPFRMFKFRTMRNGADLEKETLAHLNHTGDSRLFKIRDDPRVTRVGAWLRRWSLDELPQLWSVLIGDMSLVGPRPFFEDDLADYEEHHFVRLLAKPGITGLWQVSGRSDVVDFEEVVRLDCEYIERWSPLLDLAILVRTVPAVLRRRGAF